MRAQLGWLSIVVATVAAPVLAADPIAVPVTGSGVAMPVSEGSTDWSGFYAGVYGTARRDSDGNDAAGVGINLGVNAQIDFVLVGAEVALEGLTGDTQETSYGQVTGRAGVLLTDNVLLYAAAGYGAGLSADGDGAVLGGGGLEVAVTDNLSVKAEYLHGFGTSGDVDTNQVSLGANFHF